jgi:isopentenyl-diphosphate delta-isomerase
MEQVILVDEQDRELGVMEKMEAHEKAVLHRAFSVFLFNEQGDMLLQQRAFTKYHSGGLWTNACCSHPRPAEATHSAACRRTQEELGISPDIGHAFSFVYKAAFDNGLTEHEFDHVFVGRWDGDLMLNPEEVAAVRYVPVLEIRREMEERPELYTVWFKIAFDRVCRHFAL